MWAQVIWKTIEVFAFTLLGSFQGYAKASFLLEDEMSEMENLSKENFTSFWKALPTSSITSKARWLVVHVPQFIKKWKFWGLMSEQPIESFHHQLNQDEICFAGMRNRLVIIKKCMEQIFNLVFLSAQLARRIMIAVTKKRKNFDIFESKAGTANGNDSLEIKKRKEGEPLKIFSWNVAGLRGCIKKGCHTEISKWGADVVFLQETKCEELPPEINNIVDYPYKKLCFSKEKKGHSGVAMLSREKPVTVECSIDDNVFDKQARWIQAEFDNYYLIGVYVPNSGQKLVNLEKRKNWEEIVLKRLKSLDNLKPVIYVGDMNVAHEEIDLKNPASNRNKTAGFTDQERGDFTKILKAGFVDVWRKMNPTQADVYTYWTYIGNARSRNVGWRIDYFVISERILEKVIDCKVHNDVLGSDHCPISMTISI